MRFVRGMSLYVRLQTSFWNHRKTMRLKASLGDSALWLPPRLWSYAAESQPDGDFSSYTAEELAAILAYAGDATSMRQALLRAGFLDEDGKLHDWPEHNSYHETYAKRAKDAANTRWEKEREKKRLEEERKGKETSIASSMLQALHKHEAVEDPNTYEHKQPVTPTAKAPEGTVARSNALHAWYCEQMGTEVRLDMNLERLWFDWFKAQFTEDQFKRVFKYLKKQVDQKKRNDGALKLSNMLQPDRFNEDLALAARNCKPAPQPKAQEPEPVKSAEDWQKGQDAIKQLREQLKGGNV